MARPFLIVLPVPFGLEDVLGLRTFITVASRITVAYKLLDCKAQLKRFRWVHPMHDETPAGGETSNQVARRGRGVYDTFASFAETRPVRRLVCGRVLTFNSTSWPRRETRYTSRSREKPAICPAINLETFA